MQRTTDFDSALDDLLAECGESIGPCMRMLGIDLDGAGVGAKIINELHQIIDGLDPDEFQRKVFSESADLELEALKYYNSMEAIMTLSAIFMLGVKANMETMLH